MKIICIHTKSKNIFFSICYKDKIMEINTEREICLLILKNV